jgi:hypothetical protein
MAGNYSPAHVTVRTTSARDNRSKKISHPVAGKYFLAAFAQPGPVLLQALLYGRIIVQLLSAKALRISPAGLLFFWGAHVALCKR